MLTVKFIINFAFGVFCTFLANGLHSNYKCREADGEFVTRTV